MASDASLPVDGATIMGILSIVGSILAAPSLPQATLKTSCKILENLENKISLPETFLLLPGVRELAIHVSDNKIPLKSIKDVLKKLEIPWNRQGPHSNKKQSRRISLFTVSFLP